MSAFEGAIVIDRDFWKDGLRFECQGSGKCCVSHDGYGFVYLTKSDRQALAKHLGMSTATFTKTHCRKLDGIWSLKNKADEACCFLKGKRCQVYAARPTQCRTWPFWPEVLNARTWSTEVASFCAGVGKGRVWTAEEIEKELKAQVKSEKQYGS